MDFRIRNIEATYNHDDKVWNINESYFEPGVIKVENKEWQKLFYLEIINELCISGFLKNSTREVTEIDDSDVDKDYLTVVCSRQREPIYELHFSPR